MSEAPAERFKRLPSIDELLRSDAASSLIGTYGRTLTTEALREATAAARAALQHNASADRHDSAGLMSAAEQYLLRLTAPSLKPVFNLSGTVLHTNLGRAPLPEEAVEAMVAVARGASNLEFDLTKGKRGDRDSHLESWLRRLSGAEAVTVVNNNAAAVLLVLNTLARRKGCIVSRGELIEIGGSFRIPDVMARAGAKLNEVGTTNRTHPSDFSDAIDEQTALIMKVHTSNYVVEGFTASVDEKTLAKISRENELPFVVDLGSGTLVDLSRYGLPHEPTVAETIANGADLVTFSGDKLLGGPQAGIIAGRKDLIDRIKKNPMKRALRVDKMTIAALEAVLKLYGDPDTLVQRSTSLRWLTRSEDEIVAQAKSLQPHLARTWAGIASVAVVACRSQIGSGAQPTELLPSAAIILTPDGTRSSGKTLQRIATAFRELPQPVIGRIEEGRFVLDLRCLEDEAKFIQQLDQLTLKGLKR